MPSSTLAPGTRAGFVDFYLSEERPYIFVHALRVVTWSFKPESPIDQLFPTPITYVKEADVARPWHLMHHPHNNEKSLR